MMVDSGAKTLRGPILAPARVLLGSVMRGLVRGGIVLIALLTLLSQLGLHHWRLDLLSFGQQHYVVAGLLLALASLPARRPRWTVAAALVALFNLAIIQLKAEPEAIPAAPTATAGRPVTVLTLNLLGENYYTGRVSRYLRQTAADIVVLQENTPYWSEKLAALRDLYPYGWPRLEPFSNDVVVLSRYPLLEQETLPISSTGGEWGRAVRVVADLGDAQLAVYGVHPDTPRSRHQWEARNAYLAALGTLVGSREQGRPHVIAGDFNTPPTSVALDRLRLAADVRDTAGKGPRWPTRQPLLLAPYLSWLGAPVDHVLASPDIAVDGFGLGRHVESDHLPVIAELRVPVSPQARAETQAQPIGSSVAR